MLQIVTVFCIQFVTFFFTKTLFVDILISKRGEMKMNIKKYVNLKNICKVMAIALMCNNVNVLKQTPQMINLEKLKEKFSQNAEIKKDDAESQKAESQKAESQKNERPSKNHMPVPKNNIQQNGNAVPQKIKEPSQYHVPYQFFRKDALQDNNPNFDEKEKKYAKNNNLNQNNYNNEMQNVDIPSQHFYNPPQVYLQNNYNNEMQNVNIPSQHFYNPPQVYLQNNYNNKMQNVNLVSTEQDKYITKILKLLFLLNYDNVYKNSQFDATEQYIVPLIYQEYSRKPFLNNIPDIVIPDIVEAFFNYYHHDNRYDLNQNNYHIIYKESVIKQMDPEESTFVIEMLKCSMERYIKYLENELTHLTVKYMKNRSRCYNVYSYLYKKIEEEKEKETELLDSLKLKLRKFELKNKKLNKNIPINPKNIPINLKNQNKFNVKYNKQIETKKEKSVSQKIKNPLINKNENIQQNNNFLYVLNPFELKNFGIKKENLNRQKRQELNKLYLFNEAEIKNLRNNRNITKQELKKENEINEKLNLLEKINLDNDEYILWNNNNINKEKVLKKLEIELNSTKTKNSNKNEKNVAKNPSINNETFKKQKEKEVSKKINENPLLKSNKKMEKKDNSNLKKEDITYLKSTILNGDISIKYKNQDKDKVKIKEIENKKIETKKENVEKTPIIKNETPGRQKDFYNIFYGDKDKDKNSNNIINDFKKQKINIIPDEERFISVKIPRPSKMKNEISEKNNFNLKDSIIKNSVHIKKENKISLSQLIKNFNKNNK